MRGKADLLQRLQIEHPIFQAPMAGGGDTPELVAAVSNGGALGFIGAAYLTPEQIAETGRAVRTLTTRPFGINLFAPPPPADPSTDCAAALRRVAPYFAELDLPVPSRPVSKTLPFEEQLEAALQTDASVFSFTFGIPPTHAIEAIRHRQMILMGTATTVDEALTIESAGFDAVVTQGSEAGGHRGTFRGDFEAAMVGTISLVPQVVDAVRIPVVASGGIMDGRGIAAVLALGANAVQLGTAFLTCDEAGVPNVYKEAIGHAREDQTRVTRAFSGRPARGIANRFMTEVESEEGGDAILPFPLQNALTRPLRSEAAQRGRAEFLSLWAGQGVRLARRQSATILVATLVQELNAAIDGLKEAREKTVATTHNHK